ncbi:MAG: ThiF family adenylyltransferase, partial [Anaerolineae bacterium]|nr:ThiF family adenylyltransferase [Anaerolineae bacterium]
MSWSRVEGLLGANNLALLARKRVAVVGLGSGGGQVAVSLAMSGVGRFVLIDDDLLEEGNVVRHVADRRYIGQPKVEAVADLIRQRNPEAQIETCQGRIEQHLTALDHVDLLVAAVDGENAKYVLNQAALDRHLPAVYAGVYERGEGGDVVVIYPYDGPCYACWAAELRDENAVTANPGEELDYGMIGPEGTLEAEPGLWLHLTRVASVQAHLVLNELLKGTDVYEPMPGNTVILANNALEILTGQITPPHSAVWVMVNRDPNCLVCGTKLQHEHALKDQPLTLTDLIDSTGIVMREE